MKGFYNLLDTIKTELDASVFVNTVSYGDITRVDLTKQTIFPLSHFVVNSIQYGENSLRYEVSVLSMDVVDESKENVESIFLGNDNEQNIFNTQMNVLIKLFDELKIGDLFSTKYQLIGEPTLEPFVDRFENRLAGWSATFTIEVVNDMTC